MKLLRLALHEDFSSLKAGFQIQFRESYESEYPSEYTLQLFHPFCFAGLNGSGKSNVLEALASIFFHLDNCANVNHPDNFPFDPSNSFPNAYELEYYIVPNLGIDYKNENLVRVQVVKEENTSPAMVIFPYPFDENKEPQLIPTIANKESRSQAGSKRYLPDLIIAYSSGENEILSIPFLKTRLIHLDEYIQAIPELEYKEPESNLIYIDYEMSQAVLLANYIFQKKEVLEPLDRELGIKNIKRFRMNLNLHEVEKNNKSFKILYQFQDRINAFKRCATAFFENEDNLTLDFWINDTTKQAFEQNFKGGAFDLFRAFQILYTLNYRTVKKEIKSEVYNSQGYYTEGKLPSPAPHDKVFYFLDYYIEKRVDKNSDTKRLLMKNLSDGEQQFLHSLGICLMLRGKSALLLLDEPETHFNPDWRSKFISILKDSLEKGESNNLRRDILITSHSPFIISDCLPDKVIIFKQGENPVNARDINFRTYGTSVDIIMENVFRKNNTIGDLSRSEIEDIQKEIEGRTSLTEEEVAEYKDRTSHLGDSMEKILLFAQLNELKKQ